MLKLQIPDMEFFNNRTNEFVTIKGQELALEHSLVSVSKWESIFKKSFFSREAKTRKETIEYIKCMTLTQNVNPAIYSNIPQNLIDQVNDYIRDPMTATTFPKNGKYSREIITSELIYYWMFSLSIPIECQKWHLNRLLTLIRVFDAKSEKVKPMSKRELAKQNSALNAQRRKALHSKG